MQRVRGGDGVYGDEGVSALGRGKQAGKRSGESCVPGRFRPAHDGSGPEMASCQEGSVQGRSFVLRMTFVSVQRGFRGICNACALDFKGGRV